MVFCMKNDEYDTYIENISNLMTETQNGFDNEFKNIGDHVKRVQKQIETFRGKLFGNNTNMKKTKFFLFSSYAHITYMCFYFCCCLLLFGKNKHA